MLFKEITAPFQSARALRETEMRLRRSEQHLKHAQRIANTGSIERDLTTGISVWSDELYRILGVGRDFPPNFENFLSFVHEDDRAKLAARMRSITDLKPEVQVRADEYRIVRPDGEMRVIQPVWEVMFGDRGNATHLLAALKDVTELRAAEKRQRETEQQLQLEFRRARHRLRDCLVGLPAVPIAPAGRAVFARHCDDIQRRSRTSAISAGTVRGCAGVCSLRRQHVGKGARSHAPV